MEPDEMKAAWLALDSRMAQHNRINLALFQEKKIEKARTSLRPLFWGQILQMLFGIAFIVLASLVWIHGPALTPSVLLAGIFIHAYGVVVTAMSGMTLGLIGGIDYSAPVVAIQKQLARLRRVYVINGMIAGLPWWLLWVAVLIVLAGLGGGDLYARAPSLIWIALGIGIPGLLATWWFHRWSRRRPKLAKAMEDSLTGASLRKAQRVLDEITQFQQE